MEFSTIRKELEGLDLKAEDVKSLIASINDRELEDIQQAGSSVAGNVALVVSTLLFLSGIALWLWMRSKEFTVSFQLIAFIPMVMAIGNYLLYRKNAKNLERHR